MTKEQRTDEETVVGSDQVLWPWKVLCCGEAVVFV